MICGSLDHPLVNCLKNQQRESAPQQMNKDVSKQVNEGGNGSRALARTYAIYEQPSSESTRVIEGENFEILLRGRECENPKNFLILFYFFEYIFFLLYRIAFIS